MRHDACYSLGSTGNARSFGLMLPTIAANIRAVTEYAATKGIRTAVENHGFVAQDSYRVEQLFNAVAHDNFGLLVDVGNFVCADEDNVTAVSRVAPYAVHVHAKDMYKSTEPLPGYGQTRACNYLKGAIIGEGDANVEQCLRVYSNGQGMTATAPLSLRARRIVFTVLKPDCVTCAPCWSVSEHGEPLIIHRK